MCLYGNSSEFCDHPECSRYYFFQSEFNSTSLIAGLSTLVQQQSIVLSELVNKHTSLSQKLDNLSTAMTMATEASLQVPDEQFSIEDIFNWISSGIAFNLFIKLVGELPATIYKEKGFNLVANVVSENGTCVPIPSSNSFIVALFTVENPPKLLKTNISGKKILRGTSETISDSNGNIQFRNLVINEVTSHYPNDCFCLVIMCPNLSYIKPLATNGISIRARKHRK